MTPELLRIVERRLERTGAREQPWSSLVVAACEGQPALDAVLAGEARADSTIWDTALAEPAERPGAYITSIVVEGFRGVGPRRTLEVNPGPGLTLVIGRNGSGKSSFAEAAEILLTGTNSRWAHRSKIWQEGWRNIHHPERTTVAAAFAIDGVKGETVVTRQWADGAALGESKVAARPRMTRHRCLSKSLGWTSAVEAFRPFLSYNELGATFDEGPTEFHDRLSRDPGSRRYRGCAGTAEARPTRVQAVVDDREEWPPQPPRAAGATLTIRRASTASPCPQGSDLGSRARRASARAPGTTAEAATSDELNVLRYLANVQPPNPDEVRRIAGELRASQMREAAVARHAAPERPAIRSSCCGSPVASLRRATAKVTAPSAASAARSAAVVARPNGGPHPRTGPAGQPRLKPSPGTRGASVSASPQSWSARRRSSHPPRSGSASTTPSLLDGLARVRDAPDDPTRACRTISSMRSKPLRPGG